MKDRHAHAIVAPPQPAHRLAMLLIALALLLSPALASATPSAPNAAGVFVVAGPGYDGDTLDPALATSGPSFLIARQLYDTLVFYQDGGSMPMPGLASSWSVSADRLTWTFHLRSGARFHDGAPVTGDAVLDNLQRWWDSANPYHQGDFVYFGAFFWGFKGDPACLITNLSATGNDVTITLKTPYSPLLAILALPAFSIASPAAFAAGTLASNPVGSGAFRFVQRVPGDRVTLAANPDYWAGNPASAQLVFRSIASAADRLSALQAGDVQVADDVAAPAGPLLRTLMRGATNIGYLGINRAHGALGDPLVRQAIAHLVNLPKIAALGPEQAATQFLPTGLWGRDPALGAYTYSPDLARSLLAQAGYPSGFTTTLSYRNVPRPYMTNARNIAEALKTDFAAAGVTLTLLELPSSVMIDRVNTGDVDLFLLGWGADYPDPYNFFAPHFCAGWAAFLPEDATLCGIVRSALQGDSLEEEQSLYESASRRVHDTVPVVPLLSGASPMALRYNVVGVLPSPVGAESYRLANCAAENSTTVTPDDGGSAGYASGGAFTSVAVPPGAVASPAVVAISPADAAPVPAGLGSTGHAFTVEAGPALRSVAAAALSKPAVLTVEYAAGDISHLRERSLQLYIWDGAAWAPATATCSPATEANLDTLNRRITVPACQFGRFALFGDRLPTTYLPILLR